AIRRYFWIEHPAVSLAPGHLALLESSMSETRTGPFGDYRYGSQKCFITQVTPFGYRKGVKRAGDRKGQSHRRSSRQHGSVDQQNVCKDALVERFHGNPVSFLE